jgi:glycosyltransferase involved in cell wall biosynthesis
MFVMPTPANAARPPLVSVVTPTYNQVAFLGDTIESVLGQDYPHIEFRVLDDGSTDATPSVLAEYTGRLLWESHANRGQTATINKGWQQATGDILTWLNSDDTFLPGAVGWAVRYLEEHPDVDIVFGDTLFTDADGTPIEPSRPVGPFDYERFVVDCFNPVAQPSAFLRRRVVENTGPLDPSYYYFMDWDYWLRAGIHHRIVHEPVLLSTYRLHAESKTVAHARRSAPELERMYRHYFARGDVPPALRRQQRQALANMYFTSGAYYLKGGDGPAAAAMARKALEADPSLVLRFGQVHKLLFCFFSGTAAYQGMRQWWHRFRGFHQPLAA